VRSRQYGLQSIALPRSIEVPAKVGNHYQQAVAIDCIFFLPTLLSRDSLTYRQTLAAWIRLTSDSLPVMIVSTPANRNLVATPIAFL
jgi:hypothetical protein